MPALRLLGLVILAALASSIGLLGYAYMRAALDEAAARDSALEVASACGTVIASGGQQTVGISLPGNCRMRFVDNQIAVDNYRIPDGGFVLRFADNAPELGPGTHQLLITIDNNRLVVTRI